VIVFLGRSAISAIKNAVIRRSGGDKPRRYTLGDLMRPIAVSSRILISMQFIVTPLNFISFSPMLCHVNCTVFGA
jgi:hypothetical protein